MKKWNAWKCRKAVRIGIIAVLIIVGLFYYGHVEQTPKIDVQQFQQAEILRVKDGDTIEVNLDGQDQTVRMIGIDTPESVHPDSNRNTEQGEIASEFTKDNLAPGTMVYLEYDKQKTDQYGRTLAYLWLSNQIKSGSLEDFCKFNYGAVLLQNTYCEAKYYSPNGKYRQIYEALERDKYKK